MGISSNQARFLALTARQIDLEHRTQQICQRRIRLTSELQNIATSYNNSISDRKLFTNNAANSGISQMTLSNLRALKDTNGKNFIVVGLDKAATPANISISAGTISLSGANALTIGSAGNINTIAMSSLGLSASLVGPARESAIMEAAIRAGVLTIAQEANEFTQTATAVTGKDTGNYELKDWRSLPQISDELYDGNDVDAENRYDKTVDEINTQDKKLQLEQTSLEVEYKAISSEKEAVKKILDTNAQASFKYFS